MFILQPFVVLKTATARQSAPTDGRDPFSNYLSQNAFYTSKQNSDASGLFYQWVRKDPFTFATNAKAWGIDNERGQFPVKIYTIDGVLIYQEYNGGDNKDKQPVGGTIIASTVATSMMETIKKPSTFYGASPYTVINQVGYTRDLWSYYWASYSRGTDGGYVNTEHKPQWHNVYLNGYTSQRSKSIYDPCPYGFRIPSNGTYNNFNLNQGWAVSSYVGGIGLKLDNSSVSWFSGSGRRTNIAGSYMYVGIEVDYRSACLSSVYQGYTFCFTAQSVTIYFNHHGRSNSYGLSVRCIEIKIKSKYLL